MITPAQKQRLDTGRVRRGDMTDEEREAILSQQRQRQYDLEFLSYEDPSLYKAVMDKQAAENAVFTAANPLPEFGTLTDGSEVYQSGQSRRNIVDYLAPERGFKRDTIQKFMGGNASRIGGFGVADLLGAGLLDAADGLSFSRDMNKRNDLAIAHLDEQIIAEGVKPYSLEFYRQRNARMPEMETSFDAMLDIGIGGIEAVTLGTSRLITKPVKGFLKNLSAKFASPVTPSPSAGALPTANNVAQQTAREILELRAAGRSNEVTEQMMSAADDPYMFNNTPLDMSQEARMARASANDFDVENLMYRGSPENESVIDRDLIFSSDSGYVASTYAKNANLPMTQTNAVIAPILTRPKNAFTIDQKGRNYERIPIDETISGESNTLRKQFGDGIETWTVNGVPTTDTNRIASLGMKEFDSIQLNNIVDRGPETYYKFTEPQEYYTNPKTGESVAAGRSASIDKDFQAKTRIPSTVRINRPEDVKSQFARFDPEFRHLRNLSASILATIGFTGLAKSLKQNENGDQM